MPTNPVTGRAIGARGSQVQVGGFDDDHGDPGGAAFDPREELAAARSEAIHAARADWSQLARLHTAQAEAAADGAERARALCRAASVYREQLGDVGAALALLTRAIADGPEDPEVADELEAVSRTSAQASAEARALTAGAAREMELVSPALASELWLRAALLDAAVRGDVAAAVGALGRVGALAQRSAALADRIERAARSIDVLDALCHLWRRSGDPAREQRALLRSLDLVGERPDRAPRHRAIAALERASGDVESAEWHEREAAHRERLAGGASDGDGRYRVPRPALVEADPMTGELADRAWRARRWHALEPLVERLIEESGDRAGGIAAGGPDTGRLDGDGDGDGDDTQVRRAAPLPLPELHYRAGRAAFELGRFEKARRHYAETLAEEQVHLPAMLEHALASSELGLWHEVHELSGAALLVQRSLGRPDSELADTLHRMGEARERTGDAAALAEAQTLYESALDVYPVHRRALAAACRAHRAAGDLRAIERLLRAALTRASRRRKVELLPELAGLASRFFGQADEAVTLVREALDLAPGERRLLLALVEHCEAAGRWGDAIDAVTQLAEQEGSALRRGRYHQLAGELASQLPGGPREASAHLERALACFGQAVSISVSPSSAGPARSSLMSALRGLVAIYRNDGDARHLDRIFREVMARLGEDDPEHETLAAELDRIHAELDKAAAPTLIVPPDPVGASSEPGMSRADAMALDAWTAEANARRASHVTPAHGVGGGAGYAAASTGAAAYPHGGAAPAQTAQTAQTAQVAGLGLERGGPGPGRGPRASAAMPAPMAPIARHTPPSYVAAEPPVEPPVARVGGSTPPPVPVAARAPATGGPVAGAPAPLPPGARRPTPRSVATASAAPSATPTAAAAGSPPRSSPSVPAAPPPVPPRRSAPRSAVGVGGSASPPVAPAPRAIGTVTPATPPPRRASTPPAGVAAPAIPAVNAVPSPPPVPPPLPGPASVHAPGPATMFDVQPGATTDELDKLIAHRRELVAAEPTRAEHYAALRGLFVRARDRDGVYCACRALSFLERADRQEKEFFRAHRPDRVIWPTRGLTSAEWRRLRHPDEDPLVAAVFALSAERIALSMSTTSRRLRLRDDASASLDNVRRLFSSACSALGVTPPDLFLSPSVEADVVLANLRRGPSLAPAFVVGRHMYEGRSSTQMVQTMARALAYVRPVAFMRLLFGPSERVAAAFAAACVVGGEANDGAAADEVGRIADAIRPPRSDATWLAELRGAVRRLRERGSEVAVGRFCRALDATARRTGLLLGGALDVSAADLNREPMFARTRSRDERLADLLVHSVSDEHLQLRRSLGLGLGLGLVG